MDISRGRGRPKVALMDRVRPDWASRVEYVLRFQHHNQQWLAEAMGIDHASLNRVLHGDLSYTLAPQFFRRMAVVLGVPYEWLFTHTDVAVEVPALA